MSSCSSAQSAFSRSCCFVLPHPLSPSQTMTFAENLRAARRAASMTASELAKRAGIAQTTVHQIETGQLQNLSAATTSSIAQALGSTVEALTGQAGKARGAPPRQDPSELVALVLECPEAFVEATLLIRRIRRASR